MVLILRLDVVLPQKVLAEMQTENQQRLKDRQQELKDMKKMMEGMKVGRLQ